MRAATFAAVCVVLAATGHVLMSGVPVPGRTISVALLGTAAAAWVLAGRERGPAAVTTAAVGAQAALHTAFTLAHTVTRAPSPPVSYAHRWAEELLCGNEASGLTEREAAGVVERAGLGDLIHRPPSGTSGISVASLADTGAHATQAMGAGSTGGVEPVVHDGMAEMSSAGMLAAHLLAAVVCGLWLAHGERALFRLLRAFAARLWTPIGLLLRLVAPARSPRPRVRHRRTEGALAQLLLVHSITSRGPPGGAAAA
ncbi:hypothetical protein AB0M42_05055 [Streptomyces sp. NPDC051784]|uniref:hypothetical protein n=1 Tax=Streptomyces sp. NPDC051784 TaxID=3155805 RepID=UPI003432BA0D